MAEVLAQTYQDPDGTLHYVYYDPDTGQYRDVNMSDAYAPGSSFLPPPEDYPNAPTPDTPPTAAPAASDAPAIQNVATEGGPVQQQQMLDPTTGQWVPVYLDPEGAMGAAPVVDDTGAPAPDASGGTSGGSGGTSGGSYDHSGSYHSSSGYHSGSSGYSQSGYSSGGSGGGSSSGGSSGMANLQAARQLQSDWIAQHTQPGGGSSTQKEASVPGGAAAGAWGARSAPPVHGPSSGGGSSGGGGGQIGSTIRSIRSNILGNLGGMFGGGGSSYGGSYPSSHYHPIKPPPPFTPPDPRMHGFARPYDYLNAQSTIFAHPEYLIRRAVGASPESGEYGQLANLPMGPLAKLLADARSRTPNNPEPFINTAGRLYDKIANSPYWFNTNKLLGTLLHPKAGSALGVDFGKGKPPLSPQQQYDKDIYGPGGYYDRKTKTPGGSTSAANYVNPLSIYQPPSAGTQADEMQTYLGAINTMRYGSKYAAAVNDWDQRMIGNWASRNIRQKPGGGQSLPAYLRGRV